MTPIYSILLPLILLLDYAEYVQVQLLSASS